MLNYLVGMRVSVILFLLLNMMVSYGQSPKVPHKMRFAGITLHIREDARTEIQKNVNALTKNPYYFNKKVERAKSYFPIIERIFEEENLPDDFKFLALQESALISDAVSTSDAVGYWQFKDFTAEEMGMRVDKKIDERMNLVSATRGAAGYLKKNNFFFNNWVCALQAYQMGAGGAQRVLGNRHNGSKNMDITKETHWYVKRFLAHKIAFEDAIKGEPEQVFSTYEVQSRTSLRELANTLSLDFDELKRYNKWAKANIIPDDKEYAILVPGDQTVLARVDNSPPDTTYRLTISSSEIPKTGHPQPMGKIFSQQTRQINQRPVIEARKGDKLLTLADRAGIKLPTFLRYNDISIGHRVVPGLLYFTAKKKSMATAPFHRVVQGETPWEISQKYGIRLKNLRRYNRLSSGENVSPGTILWLSNINPKRTKNGADLYPVIELDEQQLFDWGAVLVASSGN